MTSPKHTKSPAGHWDHGTLISLNSPYDTRKADKVSNPDTSLISQVLIIGGLIVLCAIGGTLTYPY